MSDGAVWWPNGFKRLSHSKAHIPSHQFPLRSECGRGIKGSAEPAPPEAVRCIYCVRIVGGRRTEA